jgi:hypothetical protein
MVWNCALLQTASAVQARLDVVVGAVDWYSLS